MLFRKIYFQNSVYAAYMIIMFVWFNCCFSGCCSLLLNPWSLQQRGQIAVQKSQRLRQVIVQNLNCKNNNKAKWKEKNNILPLHSNSNAITGQSYSHLQNVRPKVSILSLWWGSIAVPQVSPPTLCSMIPGSVEKQPASSAQPAEGRPLEGEKAIHQGFVNFFMSCSFTRTVNANCHFI